MVARPFKQFPVIEVDDGIILRQPLKSDAERYYAIFTHPSVRPYVPDLCIPSSLYAAENEIKYMNDMFSQKKSIFWLIVDKKTNKMIGEIGYEVWSHFHHRIEVSYHLDPAYWGKGITTKAVWAVLDYAFAVCGVNRVEATVIPGNDASFRVLRKTGFIEEAVLRGWRFYKGKYIDIHYFGLLKSDYKSIRPKRFLRWKMGF